ncbi:MAG: hypothetical protein OEX81_04130 [Candidatus Pacebacteria bacterium]|nr:hypothetical protein [Candidatus Paceibacterota bacterium]
MDGKRSELGCSLSGLLTLIFLVVIVLQGMLIPINLWSITLGLMVFAGASILIGFVIFLLFMLCMVLVKKENDTQEQEY